MLRSMPPLTFGMELEVNYALRRHDGGFRHERFPWIQYGHAENEVIKEYLTVPCDGNTFMKRSCILGHMLGFDYAPGSYDDRAESFHLHMGTAIGVRGVTRSGSCYPGSDAEAIHVFRNEGNRFLPLLLASSHLSRDGIHYRDQRSHLLPFLGLDNRIGSLTVVDNFCRPNNLGTMELRMNENPAPLIPTILYPLLYSPRHRNLPNPSIPRGRLNPVRTFTDYRERIGEERFQSVLTTARNYWRRQLVTLLLRAFSDGATNKEVWELADTYYREHNDREYTAMLALLEV